ncbi:MAG TPA: L-threonylcarbamoyladenylate synthase [Candidatus Binatia bacterium]|nr:L-threonylcarbamoyladenylate synthase [Candidatus Binatia bacterium]
MSQSEIKNCKAKDGRAENLADAVAALKRGEVIVYPTETLYGLGADALNLDAVERVFRLKGRDPDNPIPVLVADQEMLRTLVAEIPALAEKLMASFWPGPLTLVLPARKDVPRPLLNSSGGIGVRISGQLIATRLVCAIGHPLTATSANPSGKEPARTAEQARDYFSEEIRVYLDGGTLVSKTGSTVVEIKANGVRIIREGEIGKSELQLAVGESEVLR